MTKRILVFLAMWFAITCSLTAQVNYTSISFGADKSDWAYNSAQDNLLNTYTVGYFSDTLDFSAQGSGQYISKGYGDAFLIKHDKDNKLLWMSTLGNYGHDFLNDVVTSADGSIFVCGSFEKFLEVSIEGEAKTYVSLESRDIMVAKYHPDGTLAWLHAFGGTETDEATALKITPAGDILVIATVAEQLIMDRRDTLLTTRGTDLVILKLSDSGNLIWAKNYLTKGSFYHPNAELDKAGNILVTSDLSGTVTFYHNGDSTKIAEVDAPDNILIKLDSSGEYIWAQSNSGPGWDMGRAIAADSDLNIYHVGFFTDSANFGSTANPNWVHGHGHYDFDCFLRKLDKNGNPIWLKTFGGSGDDNCAGVVLSGSFVYISGTFKSKPIDFDPGPNTTNAWAQGEIGFIQKYDTSGNMIWTSTFISKGFDFGFRLRKFREGYICMTGFSSDSSLLKFGQDSTYLRSNGKEDALILLFKDCTHSYDTVNLTGCDAVDFGEYTYSESGQYRIESTNYRGCDSIVVLNVTITGSPVTYMNESVCEPFVLNGITYDSSGTYYQSYINQFGCDSIFVLKLDYPHINDSVSQSWGTLVVEPNQGNYWWIDCDNPGKVLANNTSNLFTATEDGSYAVIISAGVCSDTSSCYTIVNAGMKEISEEILSIYPNPTNEKFSISMKNPQSIDDITLSVFDAKGKTIYYSESCQPVYEVDLSNYSAGNYAVKLRLNGVLYGLPIVKQ